MNSRFLSTLALCAATTLLAVSPASATQPPPFGDSITWATGKEAPSLEALRGKSVLVMFFQDWCPICNGWSPTLFRQMGEAYKDDPTVVLIALKTDGGSISQAEDYLSSRTDLEHWMIGVDENATYYRQASGDDSLYYYMWITPEGEVGRLEKSGTFTRDSNPKQFTLATDRSQAEFRKGAKALMVTDPPLAEALKPAVDLAERGLLLSALAEVAKNGSSSELQADVATFRKRIADLLDASVQRHAATIEDENNESRYLAYLGLRKIEEDFGASAPGQAARTAASAHSSAPWLSDEEEAAGDYQSIMRRAARADDQRGRERIKKSLQKMAEEFPNTHYGRIAATAGGS